MMGGIHNASYTNNEDSRPCENFRVFGFELIRTKTVYRTDDCHLTIEVTLRYWIPQHYSL